MTDHPLDRLGPRGKRPTTVRVIEAWIQQAERTVGVGAARLGWMVASGVVIAALQRQRYHDGHPRFLIKGGTYLELRLGLRARATKDLDTLFRGNFDEFITVLDEALAEPFDGITFRRTEPKVIEVPGRLIKPRRFDVRLQLRGRTWRRISIEVSADEGSAGTNADLIPAPSLAHFGLTAPPTAAGIVIDYQLAQKLHACTDPHTSERRNDRVRDVVDLHLLKSAFYDQAELGSLAAACRDVFSVRAREAERTGEIEARSWPPVVVAHPHWHTDYRTYAEEVGIEFTLEAAIQQLVAWVEEIDRHGE